MPSTIHSMTGNEIVARAAVAAGCRFFAGYPISPSSEIAGHMAGLLPPLDGAFIQMEDEIASMAAIIGGSLAGAKSMTATSGPGFSLKQENLGLACMAEVPCVIVNVMRNGPSTGMPTMPAQGDLMQAKWGTHGDHPIITIVPTYHSEIYTETIRAFNLSEKYRTPVVLMTDETLAQTTGRLEIPDASEIEVFERPQPTCDYKEYKAYDDTVDVAPLANFFTGYRHHVTGLTHDVIGFASESPTVAKALMDRMFRKLENGKDEIQRWEEHMVDDADILVVSLGSAALPTKDAVNYLRSEGVKVGLFRPITMWPFPEEALIKAAKGKSRVIVAEMNMGQMSLEVERILKRDIETVLKYNGELVSEKEVIAKVRGQNGATKEVAYA